MEISIRLAFSSVVAAEILAAREAWNSWSGTWVPIEFDKLFVGLALLAFLGAV